MSWDTHPFAASGYLYILQPDTVFSARVNMPSVTYPVSQIIYDGVTFGSIGDCRMGQTLLLGSAPGKYDLGRTYVRASSNDPDFIGNLTTVFVGYSSQGKNIGELKVLDDAYITIVDLFEEWKRPSRMLPDGSVLKDYDWGIAGITAPVAHVGVTRGLGTMDFVNPADSKLTINTFDASTSYRTDGSGIPSTVLPLWQMKDGTYVSGGATDFAPAVAFPVGKRWIEMQIVLPDVATWSLPRRYLIVALDGEDDPNLIPTANQPTWTLKEEGLTFQVNINTRLDPAAYLPGTVVMFLLEQDYAGEKGFVIAFAGWLNYQSSFTQGNNRDVERGQTIYCVDDLTRQSQLKALATTMQRETIPGNTNQLDQANIDRYWFWYQYWHLFSLTLSDVQWSETGETWPFMSFSSPGGTFYTVADNLMKGIGWRTIADPAGRVKAKQDWMRVPIEARSYDIKKSILPQDIVRLERVKKPFPTVGVMRATASVISSANASTVLTPFPDVYAVAPGHVEGQGAGEQQNGYPWLVQSQQNECERIGEDLARNNAGEDFIKATLAHGGMVGFEPFDWIELTTDLDTVGWMDDILDHQRCLIHQVMFSFDDEAQTMVQSLIVERETSGAPGEPDPIALTRTPQILEFNFRGQQYDYQIQSGTWVNGQGYQSDTPPDTIASIYANFPTPYNITAIEFIYTKGDASAHCNVESFTYSSAYPVPATISEFYSIDDTGPVGDKTFYHAFNGSPVNAVYFTLSGFTDNPNAFIRQIRLHLNGG